MTLALDPGYPLLDLLWTMLMVFGLALFFYTLVVVFRDLFGRADLSAWGKTGWTAFVLVLPLAGSLTYLISQSGAMGKRALRRAGATQLRMDAYVRSVSGDGGYRGIHDVTTTREAMTGPMRPS
jgi:hypothetical protein